MAKSSESTSLHFSVLASRSVSFRRDSASGSWQESLTTRPSSRCTASKEATSKVTVPKGKLLDSQQMLTPNHRRRRGSLVNSTWPRQDPDQSWRRHLQKSDRKAADRPRFPGIPVLDGLGQPATAIHEPLQFTSQKHLYLHLYVHLRF